MWVLRYIFSIYTFLTIYKVKRLQMVSVTQQKAIPPHLYLTLAEH